MFGSTMLKTLGAKILAQIQNHTNLESGEFKIIIPFGSRKKEYN